MRPQMRASFQAARICGPAISSYDVLGDNLMLHAAFRPQHVETAVVGAEARMAKEAAIKKRLDDGLTIYDAMGLEAAFSAAGIVQIDGTWNGSA